MTSVRFVSFRSAEYAIRIISVFLQKTDTHKYGLKPGHVDNCNIPEAATSGNSNFEHVLVCQEKIVSFMLDCREVVVESFSYF